MRTLLKSLLILLLWVGAGEIAAQTAIPLSVQIPEVGSSVRWNHVRSEVLSVTNGTIVLGGSATTASQTTIDSTVVTWTIRSQTPADTSWTIADIEERRTHRRRRTSGGSSTTPSWLEATMPDTQLTFSVGIDRVTGNLRRAPFDSTNLYWPRSICCTESMVSNGPVLAWIRKESDLLLDGYRYPYAPQAEQGARFSNFVLDSAWTRNTSTITGCPAGHVCASMRSTTTALTTLKRIDTPAGILPGANHPLLLDNSWSSLLARLRKDPMATILRTDSRGRITRCRAEEFLKVRPESGSTAMHLRIRFSDRTVWTGSILLPR